MAVIYGGFYDESADDSSFSVAGYIAPYDTWVHLDWAWRDLIKKWNIKYFKASECESGLGQFAQYRDDPSNLRGRLAQHEWDKLQEAKGQFIEVICKYKDYIRGSGASTYWEDFKRIISEDPQAHAILMDHPYYVCLQAALHAATETLCGANQKRSQEDRLYIKPIFDSHEEFSSIAKIAYEKFREKNKRAETVLLPLNYEDDMDTPALQAADMLAYEARKYMTSCHRNPSQPMRGQMQRLLCTVDRVKKLDYETLKLIVANQRPELVTSEYAAKAKGKTA